MEFLSNRYVKVYTYKGVDICALKKAIPSEGDELGYRIDNAYLMDKVFDHPDEAIRAIDKLQLC